MVLKIQETGEIKKGGNGRLSFPDMVILFSLVNNSEFIAHYP
jgi:hypothetical protein